MKIEDACLFFGFAVKKKKSVVVNCGCHHNYCCD